MTTHLRPPLQPPPRVPLMSFQPVIQTRKIWISMWLVPYLIVICMYLGQENLISDLSLGLLVLLQPSYSKVLTCTKIYTFHINNCCALESQTVFFKFRSNPMSTNLVAGLWYPRGCSDWKHISSVFDIQSTVSPTSEHIVLVVTRDGEHSVLVCQ